MKGLRQLLSAVSRSFYLSMRFLPREMRPGVAVGYLLARATDTVADTVDMDCRERLALLRMMGATVAGDASREAAASCFGRLGILSTVQTHRGEAELLARFPECLALLEALSPREQMLVRQVLSTIVEGQAGDLEYFEARSSVSCWPAAWENSGPGWACWRWDQASARSRRTSFYAGAGTTAWGCNW